MKTKWEDEKNSKRGKITMMILNKNADKGIGEKKIE